MEENNIFADGQVMLVNKPLYWTSFDAVRKIRYLVKTKKVGHAGTLDPLATGLLIICTGKFTKRINEFMAQEKEYTGTITLGSVTPTYDLESKPEAHVSVDHILETDLVRAAKHFTGPIMQTPPIHSAIKQDGKRVYELARKGIDVKMEPRAVTISSFDITKIALPLVYFRVVCTTGTYIRSLANDFGAFLGCGGHLSALCRTRIGPFTLAQSFTIEEWEDRIQALKKGS